MVDFKRFVGLIIFKCCCGNKLLTAKVTCWIAWYTLSCMIIIFSFYKLFVVMDGISVNDLFQTNAFSKGYNGKCAKSLFTTLCRCFVRIFFKFGNARLYVTDNGIHCFSWCFCWLSSFFRSSWSAFWICCMTTSFLYPLSTNYSISFLEWLW